MLTPTLRFLALPLAAVLTLAALSLHPAASKADTPAEHGKTADCGALQAGQFCVTEHGLPIR